MSSLSSQLNVISNQSTSTANHTSAIGRGYGYTNNASYSGQQTTEESARFKASILYGDPREAAKYSASQLREVRSGWWKEGGMEGWSEVTATRRIYILERSDGNCLKSVAAILAIPPVPSACHFTPPSFISSSRRFTPPSFISLSRGYAPRHMVYMLERSDSNCMEDLLARLFAPRHMYISPKVIIVSNYRQSSLCSACRILLAVLLTRTPNYFPLLASSLSPPTPPSSPSVPITPTQVRLDKKRSDSIVAYTHN